MTIKKWRPNFSSYKINDKPPSFKNGSIRPFSMINVGPSRSGKSYFIKKIYNTKLKNKFDKIVVISESQKYNNAYNYVEHKKMVVHDEYNANIIKGIKISQEKLVKQNKKILNYLLICDDLCDDKLLMCKELKSVFTLGRHLGISIIYATQKLTLCSTAMRCNANIIQVMKLGGQEMETLNKDIICPNIDIDDFESYDITKPRDASAMILRDIWAIRYSCVIVDNRNFWTNTFSRLFWFKA